jgi:hypothetical protein
LWETVQLCGRLTYVCAFSADLRYREHMAGAENDDPLVCSEAVEISPVTSRLLQQRVKTSVEGRLVPAEEARQRIQQWLSKSSTTKTR